jgi:hypothetical protein
MGRVAGEFSQELNRELVYSPISPEKWEQELKGQGAASDGASSDDGGVAPCSARQLPVNVFRAPAISVRRDTMMSGANQGCSASDPIRLHQQTR